MMALRAMWFLGLVSPIYIYAVPLLYAWNFKLDACPPGYNPCFEWSTSPVNFALLGLVTALALASVVVQAFLRRRSLARLRSRLRGAPGALLQLSRPEAVGTCQRG
jgi:hypothetical protein